MAIIPDMNDPHESEFLEYEFHRLMSMAEAYTGCERLRQKLPPGLSERVLMVQKFIDEEEALREPHRVPYTIEAMKKKVDQSTDKDNFYERI